MVKNKMASAEIDQRQDLNQQTQSSRQYQENIEALTLEAEQLKAKLEEERSKLCDVECNLYRLYAFSFSLFIMLILSFFVDKIHTKES